MNLPFSNGDAGPGDPDSAYDVRPIVAIRRQDRTVWWFAGGAIVAAALLFSALEARRRGTEQAEIGSSAATSFATPETIPELVIPSLQTQIAPYPPGTSAWLEPENAQQRPSPFAVPRQQFSTGQTHISRDPYSGGSVYQAPSPPPLVIDEETQTADTVAPGVESPQQGSASTVRLQTKRIIASLLENPSVTVIQGTLINAVLETALDSTRPGQTRAVVTRDIFGFDGTRLLIPRGSRLYGVYEADVAQGQKRAQIRWTRLLRPDGVSVALDSPAADPLGRAGVEGKVDNHILQRFGNALLGVTGNIGSALITRSISSSSPVVVALPGATQSASQTAAPYSNQITPTLKVRQGTRITVFVQHDLDFTSVEAP